MGEQPQVLGEGRQEGGSPEYENGFLCVPSDTQIRPPRITPKPVIAGLQSAIVVGPKGEEIHTDEYGRVRVQFHWDRLGKNDDKSSCWLRVAQTWGGGARGAQYIPRIGDEVLVDFLEGDPDRPIVIGSVYNSDNQPINSLKKSITQSGFRTKTHKGDGFNELRFDDKSGGEEVYIHGEKDFKVTIKNNETKTVGNILVNQIGKTATISAGEQLQFICGSSSIVLDQSGKIVIHGTEVYVTGGNTLHLDGKPIQMNMGGAGGSAAPAPASAAAAKPVFQNHASATTSPTGLGKDVDKMAAKSPSLSKNLAKFKSKKGKIEYGPAGGGSYYDNSSKPPRIVIDGAEKGNPAAATQSLAHELGHATDTQKTDMSSKAAYVNSKLRGEGQATIANLEARKEILANGGSDIGVAGARSADYEKIYNKYGNSDKSREAIGKVFGNKEITSTTKENYSDYYGSGYDKWIGKN